MLLLQLIVLVGGVRSTWLLTVTETPAESTPLPAVSTAWALITCGPSATDVELQS